MLRSAVIPPDVVVIEVPLLHEAPDFAEVVDRFSEAQARFQELGGYDMEARAHSILAGLGFEAAQVEGERLLVHAGLLPQWTPATALMLSHEVQRMMASASAQEFLGVLYGDEPRCWNEALTGYDRLRVAVNACYDELRRLKRHPSTPLEPLDDEGEEEDEDGFDQRTEARHGIVHLFLVDIGNLAEHVGQLPRVLADVDHAGDHRGKYPCRLQRPCHGPALSVLTSW